MIQDKRGITYIEVLVSVVLIGIVFVPLGRIVVANYNISKHSTSMYEVYYQLQNIVYDLDEELTNQHIENMMTNTLESTVSNLEMLYGSRIEVLQERYKLDQYDYEIIIYKPEGEKLGESICFSNREIDKREQLYLKDTLEEYEENFFPKRSNVELYDYIVIEGDEDYLVSEDRKVDRFDIETDKRGQVSIKDKGDYYGIEGDAQGQAYTLRVVVKEEERNIEPIVLRDMTKAVAKIMIYASSPIELNQYVDYKGEQGIITNSSTKLGTSYVVVLGAYPKGEAQAIERNTVEMISHIILK